MRTIDPSAAPVNANPPSSVVTADSALRFVDALRPAALESYALVGAVAEALAALPASQVPEALQALAQLSERRAQAALQLLDGAAHAA